MEQAVSLRKPKGYITNGGNRTQHGKDLDAQGKKQLKDITAFLQPTREDEISILMLVYSLLHPKSAPAMTMAEFNRIEIEVCKKFKLNLQEKSNWTSTEKKQYTQAMVRKQKSFTIKKLAILVGIENYNPRTGLRMQKKHAGTSVDNMISFKGTYHSHSSVLVSGIAYDLVRRAFELDESTMNLTTSEVVELQTPNLVAISSTGMMDISDDDDAENNSPNKKSKKRLWEMRTRNQLSQRSTKSLFRIKCKIQI